MPISNWREKGTLLIYFLVSHHPKGQEKKHFRTFKGANWNGSVVTIVPLYGDTRKGSSKAHPQSKIK